MNLVTDKAFCNIPLKNACMIIGSFWLFLTVISVIVHPSFLTSSYTNFWGFVLMVVANIILVYGASRELKWLVFCWLLYALLFFIGFPIAVLGLIFNFGNFRAGNDSVVTILLIYFINLVLMAYCTHIVYSNFYHLHKRQSKPPIAVVV